MRIIFVLFASFVIAFLLITLMDSVDSKQPIRKSTWCLEQGYPRIVYASPDSYCVRTIDGTDEMLIVSRNRRIRGESND